MTVKKQNKKISGHHLSFLCVLFLFVSVVSCSMFVFFNSVSSYSDIMQADVVSRNTPVYKIVPRENPFSDVNITEDYSVAVLELYNLGILDGYSDGTYGPDNSVNRAEFAKILAESASIDYTLFDAASLSDCFYDVKNLDEHWFSPSVCALKQNGVVKGYSDGNFGPGQNITMAEAYKIVLEVFDFYIPDNPELKAGVYSDVNVDDWFFGVANAVDTYDLNIASDKNKMYPNQDISRAGIAVLIYTAMERKDLL